jgi:hypothetical protein
MFDINLEPLIKQIQEFNQNQVRTNQLLTEILQEIQSIKNTSSVEDQLKTKK